MAYSAKFRIEFKDITDTDVKIDISKDGYGGAVTSITPTSDPLSIEWPGSRANIFTPVRGSFATLNVYATSASQFDEFFEATEKQYKMEVYYDGSVYWTGWVMVGDHIESLSYPPYMVTIKAYDLGILKSESYDETDSTEDSIIDVLTTILTLTEFDLSIKERVNVFENSITSGAAANSMLNQINMHQKVLFDDDFNTTTAYDALSKILTPLNAFIIQENNYWNICRTNDMGSSHYYRVFNTSGAVSSSGTEDTTVSLSAKNRLNDSMLMMSCQAWNNINIIQNLGYKNMVYNGLATNSDLTATDLWTQNIAGADLDYSVTGRPEERAKDNFVDTLRLSSNGSGIGSFVHDKEYKVYADWYFTFKMRFLFYSATYAATQLKVYLKLDTAGFDYWLNPNTGAWTTLQPEAVMTGLTEDEWVELEVETDVLPLDGTLSLEIFEPSWVTPGASDAFIYYDSIELYLENEVLKTVVTEIDYSEVIGADNTINGDNITLYLGDGNDTEQFDCYDGCLTVLSGTTGTNLWQSNSGSAIVPLAELCANNYRAQYETNARRLQGLIREIDYLDVLIHDSRYFLASSITRNFADATLDGEWIEIKTGWGDDITGTFANDGGIPYDTFSTATNEFAITKTAGSEAELDLSSTSVTGGTKYKLVITITDNATSDLPTFTFAGNLTTSLGLGVNTWYITADSTTSTHDGFCSHPTSGDTCDLDVQVYIYEIIGG